MTPKLSSSRGMTTERKIRLAAQILFHGGTREDVRKKFEAEDELGSEEEFFLVFTAARLFAGSPT